MSANAETMKLRDLSSRAGTFVNGKKVEPETEVPLKPGDYIRIGPLTFVCQIDGKPAKIVPPPKKSAAQAPKAKPKPEPKKAAAPATDDDLEAELEKELSGESDNKTGNELDDLDVSDSFINLDDLDSDLEDSKGT